MPIQLIRNDITKMNVDAIVNTANNKLSLSGGVNGAIHKAAGPKLLEETLSMGGCKTGEAKISSGYDLPCTYVIHTVGPMWYGGHYDEEALLTSCYRNSLKLALEHDCRSIAFPLISAGRFGYPKEQALKVAINTCSSFLMEQDNDTDLMIYILLFGKDCFDVGSKLFTGIRQYIDDNYAQLHHDRRRSYGNAFRQEIPYDDELSCFAAAPSMLGALASVDAKTISLEDELDMIDESFSQMLLRKIAEKGMKNSDCYKKANIDKKLFSKINNDIFYKPKKQTALALAIALELPLEEARELLMKAGFALSHSDKFDIIVEYFIKHGNYNIFEINEVLFYYDQPLLGSIMN